MSNHKEREIRICADSWPFLVFGMLLIKDRNMMTIFGKQFSRAWRSDVYKRQGYGLGGAHERRGYMTEAVDALCDWALQRKDVESVLAETERKNRPSQNVLRRCRFVLEHEGPTLWWRRKK